MDKTQLRNLIAEAQTAQAVEHLKTIASSLGTNLEHEVLMQSGRFEQLEKERRLGLLTREQETQEMAKINFALLEIIRLLPDAVPAFPLATDSKDTALPKFTAKRAARWGAFFVGAIGLLAGMAQISGFSLRDLFASEKKDAAAVEKPALDTAARQENPPLAQKADSVVQVEKSPANAPPKASAGIFNPGEFAKVGVVAATENVHSSRLAQKVATFLKNKKGLDASATVVLPAFASQSYFQKIMGGDYQLLAGLPAKSSMKYLLLVRQSNFSVSEKEASGPPLQKESGMKEKVVKARYEVVLMDAANGRLVDREEKEMTESGLFSVPEEEVLDKKFLEWLKAKRWNLK